MWLLNSLWYILMSRVGRCSLDLNCLVHYSMSESSVQLQREVHAVDPSVLHPHIYSDLCDHLFLLNWQHLDRHNWVDTVICVCGDLRAWLVAAGSESGAGHASRGKQPGHSILRWFYMPVGHFALFTCRWQKGQRISIICATVGVKTGHILWPYSHTVLPFPRTPNTSLIIHM